ncbi:DUF6415 family natural product biosynthesis protein [Streptomyces griseorubiginosus]|uniref:DUF6415 family natural product biosynthesis protein n=1 Tax=Streptomyces griseorubiginosus TaxID=67304 RepID=UPI0036A515CC
MAAVVQERIVVENPGGRANGPGPGRLVGVDMAHRTAPNVVAAEATEPLDIETMRETIDLLLDPDAAPDALPPVGDELETLTATVRGHIELLIPEVEAVAERIPPTSVIARHAVLTCVWEARSRLEAEPSPRFGGPAGHARRLARALNALCNHYEDVRERA